MTGRPYGRRRPVLREAAIAGVSAANERYVLNPRLLANGQDHDIQNSAAQVVFRLDSNRSVLRGTDGIELFALHPDAEAPDGVLEILHPDRRLAASIQRAPLASGLARFDVHIPGGKDLVALGDVFDHEYRLNRGEAAVADVSKRWFPLRDKYGVEVAHGQDAALVVAIVVGIDELQRTG